MSLCSTVNVKIKYWCQSIFIFLSRCLLSRPVTEDSSGLIIFCLFCFPWMCFRGQKTCAWLLFLYSYSRNNFEIGVANSMHTPLLWSTLETPPPEDWLATASTVLSLSLRETKMADRLFFTGYRLQLLNAANQNFIQTVQPMKVVLNLFAEVDLTCNCHLRPSIYFLHNKSYIFICNNKIIILFILFDFMTSKCYKYKLRTGN